MKRDVYKIHAGLKKIIASDNIFSRHTMFSGNVW